MNKKQLLLASCFFLAILPLFFYRLGGTTLTNWDEAWFAAVAQDMNARKDFLIGQWNGRPWFYEPPLVTWVLAAILRIMGPNEFWLRSFNAFFGIAIVFLTYGLTLELFHKKFAAMASSIILLSDIEFLFRSRQINVEIPLTFFLLVILSALIRGTHRPSWGILSVAALSFGFAILTKRASPFFVVPAAIFLLFKSPLVRLSIRAWIVSGFILLAVASPWYIESFSRLRGQFVREFFLGYTIGKIRSINPGVGTSPLFYVASVYHAFKLWFFVLVPSFLWFLTQAVHDRRRQGVLIFLVTVISILTVVPIKSSWYLLPVHPIFAAITGGFLAAIARRMPQYSGAIIVGILMISALQDVTFRAQFIVPNTTFDQVVLSRAVKTRTGPQDVVYLDDNYLPVLVFYSQRVAVPLRFDRIVTSGSLPATPGPGSYVLTNPATEGKLREELPFPLTTVQSSGELRLLRVESGEKT